MNMNEACYKRGYFRDNATLNMWTLSSLRRTMLDLYTAKLSAGQEHRLL